MQRRLLVLFSLLVVVALAVTACTAPAAPAAPASGSEAPPADDAAAAAGEPLKVLHFVNGVLGDKSFFDSAERGVERAVAELGVEAKTIEAGIDQTQWEAALVDAAANEEFDVLIVGTFQMIEHTWKNRSAVPGQEILPLRCAGELCEC
jgi:basic membrane protein A